MNGRVGILVLVGACASGSPRGAPRAAVHAIEPGTSHTILVPLNPVIRVGDTLQLTAMTVTADERSVSCAPVWHTFNPDVVQILPTGRVVGLRIGSATITATCVSGTVGTTLDV